MKTPVKIYLTEDNPLKEWYRTKQVGFDSIEYTRTDAFIEMACEFLKDHLAGYDICEDDIERSVESFKLAMKL